MLALIGVVPVLLVAVAAVAQAAGVGEVVPLDSATLEMLRSLSWPGAAVGIAWSPLGRAVGSWLQARGGGGQRPGQDDDRLAQALNRLADSQESTTEVLQRMEQSLAILLDRVPRGA